MGANGVLVRVMASRDPSWITAIVGLNLAGALVGVAGVGLQGSGRTISAIAALANVVEFFVWVVIAFIGTR